MEERIEAVPKKTPAMISKLEHLNASNNPETEVIEEKPRDVRERWGSTMDFIITSVGSAVGIGNMWRFPYLCYKNGGGAFLVAYIVSLSLAVIPLVFLETAIGQLTSHGPVGAWSICPIFRGYGYSTAINLFLASISYNIVISWALRYLFASLTITLPWSSCNNTWNSYNCVTFINLSNVKGGVDSATEYWEHNVLQLSDGIDQIGSLRWDIAGCLLLAWCIIFVCLWQGIRVTGKILYVTTIGPYFLIIALLVRSATLEGAVVGLRYYITPEWSKLSDMTVWVDAGTQVFWSTTLGFGILTSIGSYNTFNRNCLRAAIITVFLNSGTSFLAGFVIFMILGYMSVQNGIDISQVAESGPGLAFVAYPNALLRMPFAPIWATCFFLILCMVGFSSQVVQVESFNTCITDFAPKLQYGRRNRALVVLATCSVMFFLGLPCVTNGGMYVLQLLDYYVGSRTILFTSCIQCLVISYVYGGGHFMKMVNRMFRTSSGPFFKFMWGSITPIFLFIIFVMNAIVYSTFSYRRGSTKTVYRYPEVAVAIGWFIAIIPVLFIPGTAIYLLVTSRGSIMKRLCDLRRKELPSMKGRDIEESDQSS